MTNRNIAYGKVIKVSNETYDRLHELKFVFKVDTFGEVINKLLEQNEKEAYA